MKKVGQQNTAPRPNPRHHKSSGLLKASLILSLIVNGVIILEMVAWLTTSEQNALGLPVFLFILPVEAIITAIAIALCCVGALGFKGEKLPKLYWASLGLIIAIPILYFGLLPRVQHIGDFIRDCQKNESLVACKKAQEKLNAEADKSLDISCRLYPNVSDD